MDFSQLQVALQLAVFERLVRGEDWVSAGPTDYLWYRHGVSARWSRTIAFIVPSHAPVW